jgi:Protein of unknown function (DUF2844)
MNRTSITMRAALSIILLTAVLTPPALAALGGDALGVDADSARMKGQARLSTAAGYTESHITLPSGTVVNEYVSSEGKVFAVTWRGPAMPDLNQTLGAYFAQYQAAAALTAHAGHNHLAVRQQDLVVLTGGHMRAWVGKAYLKSLLPANFPVDDLK